MLDKNRHQGWKKGTAALACVLCMLLSGAPGYAQDKNTPAIPIKTLHEQAKKGSEEAQLKLGEMYLFGRGVKQDDKEAVRFLRLAADQRNAKAQKLLGGM